MVCELLITACGIEFPDQGSNPGFLHWEHGVLATGPAGKSQESLPLNRSLICAQYASYRVSENGNRKPKPEPKKGVKKIYPKCRLTL